MVFYVLPPKRRQTAPGKASVQDLADEILLQILDHVSTADVLKVRLACKHIVPACSTTIQQRLKTLYVHPSTGPLRKVLDICAHPVFSQEVEEVVLLGKAQWREIEKVYPRYRSDRIGRRWVVDELSNNRESRQHADLFRAWPRMLTSSAKCSDAEKLVDRFYQEYEPLISALAQLPKLHKLTFAEHVDKPGFNQVTKDVLISHAHKCATGPRNSSSASTSRVRKTPQNDQRLHRGRTDVKVLFGLFIAPRLRFTSLSLTRELPFVEFLLRALDMSLPLPITVPLLSAFEYVTDLDLTLDCGWKYTDCHLLYHHIIRLSKDTLRKLRIAFIPNAAVHRAQTEMVLQCILGEIEMPQLESFDLELLDADPSQKSTERSDAGTIKQKRIRPSCQSFDIEAFVRLHIKTLKHVSFKNILFFNSYTPTLDDPDRSVETTGKLLQMLEQDSGELEHFQWIVIKYWHDPRCKRLDNIVTFPPTGTCKKFDCRKYEECIPSRPTGNTDFEILAMAFGVELDVESRAWDFGNYVMRAVQDRKSEEGGVKGNEQGLKSLDMRLSQLHI